MNRFPKTRDELFSAVRSFWRHAEQNPNFIFVCAEMAAVLVTWTPYEVGEPELYRPPGFERYSHVMGMKIVWGAPWFAMAYVPCETNELGLETALAAYAFWYYHGEQFDPHVVITDPDF